jgi:DnaJ-class molecular chaperone
VTQPGKLVLFICIVYVPLNFIAGYVQTIEGEGMPLYGKDSFGDLFVEYNVVLPVELNSDIRQSKSQSKVSIIHCLDNIYRARRGILRIKPSR